MALVPAAAAAALVPATDIVIRVKARPVTCSRPPPTGAAAGRDLHRARAARAGGVHVHILVGPAQRDGINDTRAVILRRNPLGFAVLCFRVKV